MSDCTWLSDRIPAVVLGRTGWTPEEVRHLSQCESCRREWELVRATSRLGESMDLPGDVAATAEAVLHRLRHQQDRGNRVARVIMMAGVAAAAIVAAVWLGVGDRMPTSPSPVTPSVAGRLEIPLPELESLQPAELDSVLETMDEPPAAGFTIGDPGLPDLDSDELQRVLDSWEG
ncbi:MAG: hypothetical protein ACREMZ_00605 [Gemmatimonadales bacterium]